MPADDSANSRAVRAASIVGRERGGSLVGDSDSLPSRGPAYLKQRATLLARKRVTPSSEIASQNKAGAANYHTLRKYLLQQEMDSCHDGEYSAECALQVFMSEKRRQREEARKQAEEDEARKVREAAQQEQEKEVTSKIMDKKKKKLEALKKREEKKKAAADEIARQKAEAEAQAALQAAKNATEAAAAEALRLKQATAPPSPAVRTPAPELDPGEEQEPAKAPSPPAPTPAATPPAPAPAATPTPTPTPAAVKPPAKSPAAKPAGTPGAMSALEKLKSKYGKKEAGGGAGTPAATPAATPEATPAKKEEPKAVLRTPEAVPEPEAAAGDEGVYWAMRDFDGGYSLFAPRRLFNFKNTAVVGVAFAHGGMWMLAMATQDFKMHVALVSEQTARIMATCTGHTGAINSLTWASDNELICTCSADATLRLWSNPEWNCMRVMNVGTPLTSCVFHPTDPDLLMLADTKNKVQSLSLSSATFRESIEFNDRIKATCFTPKGDMVLFGDLKGRLFVYKYPTSSSEQMKKMTNETVADKPITNVTTAAIGASGSEAIVVINALNNKLKMCKLKWGAPLRTAKLETLKVFEVANRSATIRACFCPTLARWPGSHSVVCGGEDGSVFIFNKDKGGEPWCNMLMGHEAPVLGATWSGDGTILVTGDASGSVVIWCRDPSGE